MSIHLCEYSFEDDAGVEHTWSVYGSYTPYRPPPPISVRRYDETLCDPGDSEEIAVEYAEEGKRRVSEEELAKHDKAICDKVHENPPARRSRGRRLKDFEEE